MKPACMLFVPLLLGTVAHAQGWAPQRNVEIVVPVVPGGTNDKLARAIERTLTGSKLVNTPVTVVHRAGGGNQIAYPYVSQHAGDPHYLLMGTTTLITAHAMGASKLSFSDFTPIASIFNDYVVLTVNAASPMKSGKDLKTVIFKGSAESLTALLGGHIELVSTGATNAAGHMTAGKLRVLGVSSTQRLPGAMAVVPTWREQGVELVYGSWRSVVGTKGLTPGQVAFWENTLRKVVESAEWKAELERNYWGDFFSTGAELRKIIDREYREMKGVLVELGLAKP